MSKIVYSDKSHSLASGLAWPVLRTAKGRFTTRSAIRGPARNVQATKYIRLQNARGDATNLGLYTPDVLTQGVRGEIHSLAITFLEALMAASTHDRSSINAILSMDVESTDHSKRAIIVIVDGNIVQDSVEPSARVLEIVAEWRSQLGDYLQLYGSGSGLVGASEVSWQDLKGHASKKSLLSDVPRNLAFPTVLALGLLVGVAVAAHHYLVVLPQEQAARLKLAAAQDRTSDYLNSLAQSLASVGWERTEFLQDASAMRQEPYWVKGWLFDTLECKSENSFCEERWMRLGGDLPALVSQRQALSYQAQERARDDEARFRRPLAKTGSTLSLAALPVDSTDADMRLRPVVNELVNAGIVVQISEPIAWPPVPLEGVNPDALVKRRKVTLTAEYSFMEQAVQKLPPHVVPDSYVVSTGATPFTMTVTAYAYVK